MKRIIIYCMLCSSIFSAQAQESILKLSPQKHYQIYFVYVGDRDQEEIEKIKGKLTIIWDKDKSFLIDDKSVIDTLHDEWKGKISDARSFCWYDYFLYLIEDNKIIDEIRVNEECKQAVCKHGAFDYPAPILAGLNKSKVIAVARVRFDSLSMGRRFIADAKTNPDIYIPDGEYEEWIQYDGKITIATKDGNSEKIQHKIETQIHKKLPNADFRVEVTGGGPGYFLYHIYCDERIANSLPDFKVWMKWGPIKASSILMISNSSTPISGLTNKHTR